MSNHLADLAKAPSPPPPAPPLPPQRQGFVANALARVAQPFGYGFRPPNATVHQPENPRSSRLGVQGNPRSAPEPLIRSLLRGKWGSRNPDNPQDPQGNHDSATDKNDSPVSSRTTTHKTGIPLAALDVSPDRRHAILAGHNILRTIQISDTGCAEVSNLRTSIIAYAAAHENSGNKLPTKRQEHLVANDVKWSHSQYSSTIATAAASGQVIIYDINRPGLEVARLHEHSRQVNKLGFNPHSGQLLISGDQDGIVRLWDLRALAGERSATTCRSVRKFTGNSNSIRDLKWSPTNGVEFAFCTDSGTIQRWDFRQDKSPQLRINAHLRQCFSIDWHPDGKHLASGGEDKNIRVWDISSSDRKKKHVWELRAPQEVRNVRWRPPCWSSRKHGPPRWQCSQIAASYDQEDPRMDIWDLRRPFIPFLSLQHSDTPATALLWHSESLLWSVGSAGIFTQTDIKFAPKTMSRRSPNTFAIAPDGQMIFFSQKRERKQASFEDALDGENQSNLRLSSTGDGIGGSSPSTGKSSYEDTHLLNPSKLRQRKQRKQPTAMDSFRSSFGTTPAAPSNRVVEWLDQTLKAENMYPPSQAAAAGQFEDLFDKKAFMHLTHYEVPSIPTDMNEPCNLHTILGNALRNNSKLASEVQQYRLSSTLELLAKSVEGELKSRAEASYQRRICDAASKALLASGAISPLQLSDEDFSSKQGPEPPLDTPGTVQPIIAHAGKSEIGLIQAEEMGLNEANADGQLPGDESLPKKESRYILQDFSPTNEESAALLPFEACSMIEDAFTFHAQKLYEAQMPSWLILNLGPWFNHSIPYERGAAVVKQYYQQLKDMGCYVAACALLKQKDPQFQGEEALHMVPSETMDYFCPVCELPPKGPNPFRYCERCKTKFVGCTICGDEGPYVTGKASGPADAMYTYNMRCGHWAHLGCMKAFQEDPEYAGVCPVPGCTVFPVANESKTV